VRTIFIPATFVLITTLTGCSTTTLQGSLSAGASSLSNGANTLWSGASKLWPAGVWPASVWTADYEEAEQLSSASGKGTMFLFTNNDLTREDSIREFLEDPAARGVAADYVPALLFHRIESDRRYAAQFGVHRAPAVIVLHPDGTYHATQGSLSTEKLAEFLSESSPPGSAPTINPHVTRRLGYAWNRDWESAKQASQASGKPIFVVLERWMSRDWDALRPMLERREAYSRVANMIHCRPSTAWSSASGVASQLGIQNLPAVAIVPANGEEPYVLELPPSYEAIVRFADQASGRTLTDAQP
jgi:hypothetical protein